MKNSLTFVPADGSIRIQGCPVDIAPHLTKTQARASFATFQPTSLDHGNGYEWLTLRDLHLGDHPCGISLCFFGERLERVHWGVELPNTTLDSGWPTREAFEEEVTFVRNFLGAVYHRSFRSGKEKFSWGVVWSVFDPKGFTASSGLRYAH